MQKTKNEYSIYGGWRPKRYVIQYGAPFYDWLLILRAGRSDGRIQWGSKMRPSQIGNAVTYLLGVTEAKGLCGMVLDDAIRKNDADTSTEG